MLIPKDEMRTEVRENIRGGTGPIHFQHPLPDEMLYGHGRLFAVTTLQPGDSIGWHEHNGESESYYILRGTAKVNDNGTETILRQGDCSVCPDGQGHAVENCGSDLLQFIALIVYGRGINQ